MWQQLKNWLHPAPRSNQLADDYQHLVRLGEVRARIYDLQGTSDYAGDALQQITHFEERFSQLRRLRANQLNPSEILSQRLESIEREIEHAVLARLQRLCELMELSTVKPNKQVSLKIRHGLDLNEAAEEQLARIITQLIEMNSENEHAITDEVEHIVKIMKQVSLNHLR